MTSTRDQGLYADRPAPSRRGRFYDCTDSNLLLQDTGAAWSVLGPSLSVVNLPVAANFAWLNQGSAAVDYTTGPMVLTCFGTGDGSNHLRAQIMAAPAAPYGVFVQLSSNLPATTGTVNAEVGIVAYDSVTGKAILWGPSWRASSGASMEYQLFTTVDAATDGPYPNTPAPPVGGFPWIAFQDGGTNRRILYGNPDGSRFSYIWQEASNANGGTGAAFTPNKIGIGVNPCGPSTFQVSVTVYSWSVTSVAAF